MFLFEMKMKMYKMYSAGLIYYEKISGLLDVV